MTIFVLNGDNNEAYIWTQVSYAIAGYQET